MSSASKLLVIVTILTLSLQNYVLSQWICVQIGQGILKKPWAIVSNHGLIYVTDIELNQVFCFMTDGRLFSKSATKKGFELKNPRGIGIGENGQIYIADTGNRRIVIYTPELEPIGIVDRYGDNRFVEPVDVVPLSGYMYVLDAGRRQIIKVGYYGSSLGVLSGSGLGTGNLSYPTALRVFEEKIYVADPGAGIIRVFNQNGSQIDSFGVPGTSPESLAYPSDVNFDDGGNMYVVDHYNHDILIYPFLGIDPISWGRFGDVNDPVDYFYSEDVPSDFDKILPGCLNFPSGVTIDGGCIFVADSENGRILLESLKYVWKTPRFDSPPFQTQQNDNQTIIASPSTLDFGVISKKTSKPVTIRIQTGDNYLGQAWLEGLGKSTVSPWYFTGSLVTLNVELDNLPKMPINGNLVVKIGQETLKIPVIGSFGDSPGITFDASSGTFISMSDHISTVTLSLSPQNGFKGDVDFTVLQPRYSTSWAKPAKGVEEIVLTTVKGEIDPPMLILDSTKTVLLSLIPIGRVRPGVYTFEIVAKAKSSDAKSTHTVTLLINSKNPTFAVSPVLLETFTAHWCETCGFHREAQYRLLNEYGLRRIIPVAFHTLDDADIPITGMTQPENYTRFKMYGGEGVPLSVINGEVITISGSKDLKFAPDRIRGRRYSGTTFEYWKMRAAYDSAEKISRLKMQLDCEFDGKQGWVWLKLDPFINAIDGEGLIQFLLVEDDIFYNSSNQERYHHCVVRSIIKPSNSKESAIPVKLDQSSIVNFPFELKPMPEGFDVKPRHSRIIALVQEPKTLKILGVARCEFGPQKTHNLTIFKEKTVPSLRVNTKTKVSATLVNLGNVTERFRLESKIDTGLDLSLDPSEIWLPPMTSTTVELIITTPSDWEMIPFVSLIVTAIMENGETKSVQFDFRQ